MGASKRDMSDADLVALWDRAYGREGLMARVAAPSQSERAWILSMRLAGITVTPRGKGC